MYLRIRYTRRLAKQMHIAFEDRKALAIASSNASDQQARAQGASVVTLMGELKQVHRFKDVRQVSILCRDMRKWDLDGIPDPDSTEFGEFALKCGMAHQLSNPVLLIMYANFLIEVRKDGQGARTQLQLAQKASPSWLDNFNVFVASELAKKLNREGDSGLDLMGYVEFQRNFRACVRAHKMALMAQRQFWTNLLKDKIAFKEISKSFDQMEAAETRATLTYRRVLERYNNNGRLLKVYGRFLEHVRNDPWTASKFYEEAIRQGTTESLLSMTVGGQGTDAFSAAGTVNEKMDGLVIINAQGIILMVNAAMLGLFGYDKGELEGKNVSVLMPQPISTHHNMFLQRYLTTGEPHIINTLRSIIGLRKDRAVFPLQLCVSRLSGMGTDTLFMGVLRPALDASSLDVVKFWLTASGTIMCCDPNVGDSFGLNPTELVGRQFNNLCTDVEGINRFVARSSKATVDELNQLVQHAQFMHAFLPPVDVELTVAFGGAIEPGSEFRILEIKARVLVESAPIMVLDHKGRIVYATDRLANMLGHSVTNMYKMDLNALLPQPYCQMHAAWFKDLTHKPNPTSCRAGGVVNMLAANGTKMPVTLKMSVRELPDGKVTHVVQVMKASESARLDQQRLLLTVNHRGTVLDVNQGALRSMYGFTPSDLIGRPLAAVVDVFGLWRHEYQEDSSLLALLATQAMNESGGCAGGKGEHRGYANGSSWRVGVHLPVKTDDAIAEHAAQLAAAIKGGGQGSVVGATALGSDSLLHTLQQRNRLRPSCMTIELVAKDEDFSLDDDAVADKMAVLQVSLFRADSLTANVELDNHLAISRADSALGIMLGISAKQMVKKSLPRLIGMSASTTFEDLLGVKGAAAKKGALKSSTGGAASSTSRLGVPKKVTAQHLSDGKPLQLEMQVLSYEQGGKNRMIVRLQLVEPVNASFPALVALREGKAGEGSAAAKAALVEETPPAVTQRAPSVTDSEDSGPDKGGGRHAESNNRISDWVREVRETSQLPGSPGASPRRMPSGAGPPDDEPPQWRGMGRASHAPPGDYDADEASAYLSVKPRRGPSADGGGGKWQDGYGGPKGKQYGSPG
eukprot:GHRR01013642.1.p1 GENE.GHRR01013642.1~~GHRR01013642.1.p1  ORF type:complete len:1083 (+),score=308.01 GHRR01013642.1:2122-5370(+)